MEKCSRLRCSHSQSLHSQSLRSCLPDLHLRLTLLARLTTRFEAPVSESGWWICNRIALSWHSRSCASPGTRRPGPHAKAAWDTEPAGAAILAAVRAWKLSGSSLQSCRAGCVLLLAGFNVAPLPGRVFPVMPVPATPWVRDSFITCALTCVCSTHLFLQVYYRLYYRRSNVFGIATGVPLLANDSWYSCIWW